MVVPLDEGGRLMVPSPPPLFCLAAHEALLHLASVRGSVVGCVTSGGRRLSAREIPMSDELQAGYTPSSPAGARVARAVRREPQPFPLHQLTLAYIHVHFIASSFDKACG